MRGLGPLKSERQSVTGSLLVEAIVASFLMVFAFLASASLYDGSLKWETRSSNLCRATLLAERKMEELRARTSVIPSGSTFALVADAAIDGSHPPYPDSPGFTFEVETLPNEHKKVQTSGFIPKNGVISPGSNFSTEPLNPGSQGHGNPPYGPLDPDGDFQKNATYSTYPYSRRMPNTYRLVQVTVRFGDRSLQMVRLISLLSDPILPPARPTGDNLNNTLKVVKESGPTNLTADDSSAIYRIEVTTSSGATVEDVSAIWSIHPLSSGTADIFTLDASGTRVRLTRNDLSLDGTKLRLYPRIRYEGIEARAESEEIGL
ncbi:MAG: hypothetical protein KC800_01565 [Candidatus Eremiobacteraeota bacterium]|nr:hypothetical protein [Candidatus Eremiobacteraeota bacterium]